MPFVKVLIHAVWGTKNRYPFLTTEVRKAVIEHIMANAKTKGIYIDRLNGYTEHLHCLFALNADMSVSKAMQLIKGESAFWINRQRLTVSKFEWADEYFAASVSDSAKGRVRAYINNQEEHHTKETFAEEYERFMEAYSIKELG